MRQIIKINLIDRAGVPEIDDRESLTENDRKQEYLC